MRELALATTYMRPYNEDPLKRFLVLAKVECLPCTHPLENTPLIFNLIKYSHQAKSFFIEMAFLTLSNKSIRRDLYPNAKQSAFATICCSGSTDFSASKLNLPWWFNLSEFFSFPYYWNLFVKFVTLSKLGVRKVDTTSLLTRLTDSCRMFTNNSTTLMFVIKPSE